MENKNNKEEQHYTELAKVIGNMIGRVGLRNLIGELQKTLKEKEKEHLVKKIVNENSNCCR